MGGNRKKLWASQPEEVSGIMAAGLGDNELGSDSNF